jgi:hypothetical protein
MGFSLAGFADEARRSFMRALSFVKKEWDYVSSEVLDSA